MAFLHFDTSDKAELTAYIREIEKQGKMYLFYKSGDWLELRDRVMEDNFHECQRCLGLGKVTRADTVHHVNEVRVRPDLALSRTYIDRDGNERDNLLPLCNACHNIVHDKFAYKERERKPMLNEERW